ncbi:MAG: MFS transporter [Nitrososphaerales archaeon]
MKKVLILVYIEACIVGIAYGAHTPLLPVFVKVELDASYLDIGLIGMANYLPYMFAPAFVGLLLDRFNKGLILSAGIATAITALFILSFTHSVLDVMLVRAVTGIAHAFFWPPSEALVASATSPERRVQAISRFTMAWVGGYMAGPLVGAAIFEKFGFRLLFEYSAVIMIGSLIAGLFLIRHSRPGYQEKYSIKHVFTVIKVNPRLSTLILYYSASFGIILTVFPAYLKDNMVNEFFIGVLFFIFGLSRLFTLPFTDRFAKYERTSIFLATQTIAFAMLAAYSLTMFGSFAVSLIMLGFAFSLYFPITLNLITKYSPKYMLGSSVGAYETMFGIGWAIGPIVSGIAAHTFGSNIPYISMFIIGIILPIIALKSRDNR